MKRGNRPSITQIGIVQVAENETIIRGWALGICMAGCSCHRDAEGGMRILSDPVNGRLGLISKLGGACNCCSPWTAKELAAICRFLEGLDSMGISETI